MKFKFMTIGNSQKIQVIEINRKSDVERAYKIAKSYLKLKKDLNDLDFSKTSNTLVCKVNGKKYSMNELIDYINSKSFENLLLKNEHPSEKAGKEKKHKKSKIDKKKKCTIEKLLKSVKKNDDDDKHYKNNKKKKNNNKDKDKKKGKKKKLTFHFDIKKKNESQKTQTSVDANDNTILIARRRR